MQWYSSVLIYHITSNIRHTFFPIKKLRYILNLRTREAVVSKAKECAKNSNIPFKASRGGCGKFMKTEGLSL